MDRSHRVPEVYKKSDEKNIFSWRNFDFDFFLRFFYIFLPKIEIFGKCEISKKSLIFLKKSHFSRSRRTNIYFCCSSTQKNPFGAINVICKQIIVVYVPTDTFETEEKSENVTTIHDVCFIHTFYPENGYLLPKHGVKYGLVGGLQIKNNENH